MQGRQIRLTAIRGKRADERHVYRPRMTYRITGIEPSQYAHLVGLGDDELSRRGAKRMIVDNHPGFPCRVLLDDAAPGEPMLLVNHVSHEGNTPYRASHAIFVSERGARPATFVDEIPPGLDRRILSLRGFDQAGMMADAMLAQPGEADAMVRRMLSNPDIDHVDAHTATRGCFMGRFERS